MTAAEVPQTTVHPINTFKLHYHDITRAKVAWVISFCFVVIHMGQKRSKTYGTDGEKTYGTEDEKTYGTHGTGGLCSDVSRV